MEPGYSVEMKAASMDHFTFPGAEGGWWRSEEGQANPREREDLK